ncbi:hypothetical protein GY45DRAFT_1255393, partial [Cubamyces sp. BRFM 1775]
MTEGQFETLVTTLLNRNPAQAKSPNPESRPQRLRVREPDMFTGDRTTYRTWKSQMERYLASYRQSTEDDLISALMSYIRGPGIDEWVNAYAEQHFDADEGEWDRTLAKVWEDLDAVYTDRVGEHAALQRMRELRQRPGQAAEYFTELEKLMWMAG